LLGTAEVSHQIKHFLFSQGFKQTNRHQRTFGGFLRLYLGFADLQCFLPDGADGNLRSFSPTRLSVYVRPSQVVTTSIL
jgi:hypothetical protein